MPLSSENFTRRGILSFLWFLQYCRSSYLFFQTEKDHFRFPVNVKPNFWLHIHMEFSLSFGLAHKKNICTRPVDSCWLEMSKNYFLIFCFCLCHAVSPAAFLLCHFWGKVNKTLSQSHQGPALFPNSCFTLVSGVTDNVYFFPNTNSIWWNTDLKCYKCDCCYSTCAIHLGSYASF